MPLSRWFSLSPVGPARSLARRAYKLAHGYATNSLEQIVWSAWAKSAPLPPKALVLGVLGQSNASNFVRPRFNPPDPRIVNFIDGRCYVAGDPLLGCDGWYGNAWIPVARKCLQVFDIPAVVLVPMAVAGSESARWNAAGDLYPVTEQRLAAAKRSGFEITHFLWHQGESDNRGSPEAYTRNVLELVDLTRRYFPDSSFYVAQTTLRSWLPPDEAIRAAQVALVDKRPRMFRGPDTDDLVGGHRHDKNHFSPSGAEVAADRWINAIIAAGAIPRRV